MYTSALSNHPILIPRIIEPGNLTIFDTYFEYSYSGDQQISHISILGLRDDDVFYDHMVYVHEGQDEENL